MNQFNEQQKNHYDLPNKTHAKSSCGVNRKRKTPTNNRFSTYVRGISVFLFPFLLFMFVARLICRSAANFQIRWHVSVFVWTLLRAFFFHLLVLISRKNFLRQLPPVVLHISSVRNRLQHFYSTFNCWT